MFDSSILLTPMWLGEMKTLEPMRDGKRFAFFWQLVEGYSYSDVMAELHDVEITVTNEGLEDWQVELIQEQLESIRAEVLWLDDRKRPWLGRAMVK